LWVYTSICGKTNRPQSNTGKIIAKKYDDWIEKSEDPEAVEKLMRSRMQSEAMQKVKEAFLKAVKPLIPAKEPGKLDSVMNLVEISLKATIEGNTTEDKLKINRKEAKRRLQNLIMSKTANYAARWLYRLLKRSLG
jgi:hypothetical protein